MAIFCSRKVIPVPDDGAPRELLFAYGTLLLEPVQLSVFSRTPEVRPDTLSGFALFTVEIDSASVLATSGRKSHPIIRPTGRPGDQVPGKILKITVDELAKADRYEVAEYRRIAVNLDSGFRAWVYTDAG